MLVVENHCKSLNFIMLQSFWYDTHMPQPRTAMRKPLRRPYVAEQRWNNNWQHSVAANRERFEPSFSTASSETSSVSSFDKRGHPNPPKHNIMFQESRYKTELCRQFMELGVCEYNDRCLFAHGAYELKSIPHRHPKFKTERCSAFHDIGFCAFGPRCSFIHEQVDADTIIGSLSKKVPTMPMPENLFTEWPGNVTDLIRGSLIANAPVIPVVTESRFMAGKYHDGHTSVDKENIVNGQPVMPSYRLPIFTSLCEF